MVKKIKEMRTLNEDFMNDPLFKHGIHYKENQIIKSERSTMPKPKINKKLKNKPFHSHKLRELF